MEHIEAATLAISNPDRRSGRKESPDGLNMAV